MKFDYEEKNDWVAALYYFNGGPSKCLQIKTANPFKDIWVYEHNETFTIIPQLPSLEGRVESHDENLIRKFYKGDSITITF